MKTCTKCHNSLDESEFAFKSKKLGKLQPVCRVCHKLLMKQHYRNNKQYYVDKARRNESVLIKASRDFVIAYLQQHPCVDCGQTNILVLDFDHVKGKKESTICELLRRKSSVDRIKREIEKCEVRCSNCHRKRTSMVLNWFKYTGTGSSNG